MTLPTSYVPKNWSLGDSITESDLEHLENGVSTAHDAINELNTLAAPVYVDSGWVGLGGSIEPNWTASYGIQRRVGKVVTLQVIASYSADIASDATGAISGGAVPVYVASDLPPAVSQYWVSFGGPPMVSGYITATTGVLRLSALSKPSHTITAGTALTFNITYML